MTVSVVEVEVSHRLSKHFDDFLSLPKAVYEGDRNYSPTSRSMLISTLSRESFRQSQNILLAYRDGFPVARLVARINAGLNDQLGQPYGMIGFFEALDDQACVGTLFQAGVDFLATRGAKRIIGPMDGDTWHRYRLNVGPFDSTPFLLEPYNASYYSRLWQQFGFEPVEQYYSQHIGNIEPLIGKLQRLYDRAISAEFRFRQINLDDFDRELEILYQLTVNIFSDNFLYTDISLADFRALYADARPLLNSRLVWLAAGADDEPVGFVFAIPDFFRAVASMRGGTGWLAKLRFVLNKRKANAVNVKTLGVAPHARGAGVAAALLYLAYSNAYELGFHRANACLIREGNASGRFDFGLGHISRRYELYEYQVPR